MSLRQKITLSLGALFVGLLLLFGGGGRLALRIVGAFMALDGLFLLRLWYRCPRCDRRLDWRGRWTYCPHCGGWIDYDKRDF